MMSLETMTSSASIKLCLKHNSHLLPQRFHLVSAVNSRSYHTATLLGLLPAQAINVYLGSTLRSMHDVFNDNKTALTGYCMFAIQVLIGVSLMVWVVQKARTELSTALLSDMGVDHKLLVEIEA